MTKNKINNKGFSLVELIIVIAIMSVLVAILAPAYFNYIEDAKEADDAYTANEIIQAAKLAIISPRNNIPPGHFVELIWICGDESGSGVTKGTLIIRDPEARISVFNDTKDLSNNVPGTNGGVEALRGYADSVYAVLNGETSANIDNPKWLQVEFKDADSELANKANLAFHINTSTGEVALAQLGSTNLNEWVTRLGIQATLAP